MFVYTTIIINNLFDYSAYLKHFSHRIAQNTYNKIFTIRRQYTAVMSVYEFNLVGVGHNDLRLAFVIDDLSGDGDCFSL